MRMHVATIQQSAFYGAAKKTDVATAEIARGYRILIGNPDAVSNVAPLANSYRANKDNFARFLNLDFCSAVVDDAA